MRHRRCLIFVAVSPPICSYSPCWGQRAISERTRFRNRLDFRNRTLAHGSEGWPSSSHQSGFHPMVTLATGRSDFHTDSRDKTKSALKNAHHVTSYLNSEHVKSPADEAFEANSPWLRLTCHIVGRCEVRTGLALFERGSRLDWGTPSDGLRSTWFTGRFSSMINKRKKSKSIPKHQLLTTWNVSNGMLSNTSLHLQNRLL